MEEIIKQLEKLLDDKRTGLKDSSNTNKTRYDILGLFQQAKEQGKKEERDNCLREYSWECCQLVKKAREEEREKIMNWLDKSGLKKHY